MFLFCTNVTLYWEKVFTHRYSFFTECSCFIQFLLCPKTASYGDNLFISRRILNVAIVSVRRSGWVVSNASSRKKLTSLGLTFDDYLIFLVFLLLILFVRFNGLYVRPFVRPSLTVPLSKPYFPEPYV